MPARVTVAPDACKRFSVSPNQAHATTIASTGSSIPVIPARVALMCRNHGALIESMNLPLPVLDRMRAGTALEWLGRDADAYDL